MTQGKEFKGRQFTAEVILWAVRWYLMFPISYRDLELMLQDRGVAEEGCVVHRDATVLQHQLEIAVADREHQVPAHGPQDHLGRELPALELLALRHATRAAIRLSRRPVYPIRIRFTNLQQILTFGGYLEDS